MSREILSPIRGARALYRAGDEDALADAAERGEVDLERLERLSVVSGFADVETRGYADMKKDELEDEAESRELEVTRSDGKDGDPLVSDYVAALEADDG